MIPRTTSERLKGKLGVVYPAMAEAAQRLWETGDPRQSYRTYLGTMHGVVRSAVPLMEAAATRARGLEDRDPAAAMLGEYLTHHIPEESGHDAWLLEDLAAAGGDPGAVLDRMPSAEVASLVGAQYYWIRHHHPVAILGHIAAIEGNHPPPGFAERLRRLTGFPAEAFRAIARHEVLDLAHKQEMYDLIDRLPLTPRLEKIVTLSGLHTLRFGAEILDRIPTLARRDPYVRTLDAALVAA